MEIEEKSAVIEAILFASGEPVEINKIAQATGIEKETVGRIVEILNDRYGSDHSALKILKLEDSYQLTTREQYSGYIKAVIDTKKGSPLSNASVEVLTIVAYNQPITKAFVENVRGVDSGNIVNSLVEKELLEEAGRLDVPGRPILYKTTDTFLRCFQLSSIGDLPSLPNHNEQVTFGEIPLENDNQQGE